MKAEGQRIRVKTSPYFPKTVRAIGAVFSIFGLAMIWTTPVIGLLFLFITSVIFTTHYGFEVRLNPNSFREFVWVLGFMDGKRLAFKSVDFLFIQRGKLTFLTYTLREKEEPAFEAYLKFEGRNEVQFLTEISKEKLLNKMKNLASSLSVPIKDYSDGDPVTLFTPSNRN